MGCSNETPTSELSGSKDEKMVTGNQWTPDNFAHLNSKLATEGSVEFVNLCQESGSCELDGKEMEGFKAVLKKIPCR